MMRIFLLILIGIAAFGFDYIKIDKKYEKNITPYVYYYLDKTSALSLKDLRTFPNLFKKSQKPKLLFGYKYDSTLWLAVPLENETNETLIKVLEYDYPIQEYLWFFDGNETIANGYRLKKPSSKYITHPYFLKLAPHQKRIIYIKAQDKNVGLVAKLNLLNVKSFFYKNESTKIFDILFFGAIIALLIYNAYLFILIRDPSYLFYVIMVGSFFVLELFEDGFFFIFFKGFYLDAWMIYLLLLITAEAIIGFTVSYLEIKTHYPKLYLFLLQLALFLVILFFLNVIGIVPTVFQRMFYLFLFFVILLIGFYALLHGTHQAKYYLGGWCLLFLYTLLLGLHQAGFADWLDHFPYLGRIAVFSEAILFSMALSARINTYKKEREEAVAQLLRQQHLENVQLEAFAAKKTRELLETLHERELLLKELHHRVKNNLQIIVSLLRLQADSVADVALKKILTESENRIKAISSVHEMLYQSTSLARINAQEYFSELSRNVLYSLCDKQMQIDIRVLCDVTLPMDKAIYLGLVVNELITNSLKHAFKNDRGTITLRLEKREERYILEYEDDGKGLAQEDEKHLGMILIQTLVEKQLKGKIEVLPWRGAKYRISFMESSPSPKIATKQ